MKPLVLSIALIILLAACGSAATPETVSIPEPVLTIVQGEKEQTFSVEDLMALPSAVSSFNEIDYLGVPVKSLLEAAGINPEEISAIKAIASDGYSVNYEPEQLLKDDVLVAYSLADGSSMASDDGRFRMVLPDQEGNQNLRLLYKLKIIP